MKKLNLNVANLGATEVLSREELKKVLGGTGTGSEGGITCSVTCAADYNYLKVEITHCIGTCSSDIDWVMCTGTTKTLTKGCDGSSVTEDIP